MTELFTTLENGQLEINWESLELMTSSEFTSKLNYFIKNYDYEIYSIEDTSSNLYQRVEIILGEKQYGQYLYLKFAKSLDSDYESIDSFRLCTSEIRELAKVAGIL